MANHSNRGMFQKHKAGPPRLSNAGPPPVQCSAAAGMKCSELLEALKCIQSVMKCYSCLRPLTSVRTCLRGHGICSHCSRLNQNCPLPNCNAVVLNSKHAMLNDVIELLPRPCRFVPQGCKTVVFPNQEHVTYCRFRGTDCRFPSCDWTGSAKDLLLHLERCHGEEMIRTASQTQILHSFDASVAREGLAVIVAYNNIFWRHVRVYHNQLVQFYQYVPMEKPQKKYSVRVEYHTPEANYTQNTPVFYDHFDREKLFTHRNTFCLPRKIAKSFNRFYAGVYFTFKIFQNDL